MAVSIGTVPTFADVEADKAQALKVIEEAAEVYAAWQDYDEAKTGYVSTNWARLDLVDECADLMQAVCNLLAAIGEDDMSDTIERCRTKNEGRGREYAG